MPGSTRPLPVQSEAGFLPSLGLQWRPSSAPGTPQPRPRLLLPAQQLRPPRPFSPRTPRVWAACACADPSSPPAFPTKALSTRSPVRMRLQEWVGGVGGVFSFPPETPHPSSDRRLAHSQLWVQFDHPIIYPRCPHFCTMLLVPALPVPAKLLWCGLEYTMPGFPSMTPRSQTQRSLAVSLTVTRGMEMARGCQLPLCCPALPISMAPRHTGNICFPSYSVCSLCITALSVLGLVFFSQQPWEVAVSIPILQIRKLKCSHTT